MLIGWERATKYAIWSVDLRYFTCNSNLLLRSVVAGYIQRQTNVAENAKLGKRRLNISRALEGSLTNLIFCCENCWFVGYVRLPFKHECLRRDDVAIVFHTFERDTGKFAVVVVTGFCRLKKDAHSKRFAISHSDWFCAALGKK